MAYRVMKGIGAVLRKSIRFFVLPSKTGLSTSLPTPFLWKIGTDLKKRLACS